MAINPELLRVPEGKQTSGLVFRTDDGDFRYVSPKNKHQLQQWMKLLFGIILPAKSVCKDHVAPLDAAWAAYSGDDAVIVWLASRGFGGKTTILAGVSLLELLDGANISILGGSGQQSQRVHEVEIEAWNHTIKTNEGYLQAPLRWFIMKQPNSWLTRTRFGNSLVALTASTKSARGPHPQRLRIDEADEMDLIVFNAAQGQPMAKGGISRQTTISSTHQYPDGTMTDILKRAKAKGWPVMEWCYKETCEANEGWLSQDEIDGKRSEVTEAMWDAEYDLQEPSATGRIFTADNLRNLFNSERVVADEVGKRYLFERVRKDALYATAADWAKDRDYTVIVTIRYDCTPMRVVAYQRTQKEPWPTMLGYFNARVQQYGGVAVHDATGHGGSVIDDYLEVEAFGHVAVGEARKELYTEYQFALDHHMLTSPTIESVHSDHKYMVRDDLLPAGHVPDNICAYSLAVLAARGKLEPQKPKRRPGRILRPRKIRI